MFDQHGSFVLRLFGISASSFPLICILGLWPVQGDVHGIGKNIVSSMQLAGGFCVVDVDVHVMMNVSKVMHTEFECVRDAAISQSRIRPGEKVRFRQSDACRMNPADSFFEVSV